MPLKKVFKYIQIIVNLIGFLLILIFILGFFYIIILYIIGIPGGLTPLKLFLIIVMLSVGAAIWKFISLCRESGKTDKDLRV